MNFLHPLLRRCLLPAAAGALTVFLGSCASDNVMAPAPVVPGDMPHNGPRDWSGGTAPMAAPAPPMSGTSRSRMAESYASGTAGKRSSASIDSRPGLGTAAGYSAYDRVDSTSFYRRSDSPDAVASFHYNDERGAKAMADLLGGGVRRTGLFETAGGYLKAGLVSYADEAFPRLEAKGRKMVIGQPGQTYEIRLENVTPRRIEVVTSVDSINVLTGKKAGTRQRGYVLEPRAKVNISGFRINDSRVNRFTFSSVAASKAAGQGLEQNVGVVGLAVFAEDEAKATMKLRQEQFQREDADAFPVTAR